MALTVQLIQVSAKHVLKVIIAQYNPLYQLSVEPDHILKVEQASVKYVTQGITVRLVHLKLHLVLEVLIVWLDQVNARHVLQALIVLNTHLYRLFVQLELTLYLVQFNALHALLVIFVFKEHPCKKNVPLELIPLPDKALVLLAPRVIIAQGSHLLLQYVQPVAIATVATEYVQPVLLDLTVSPAQLFQ